MGYCITAMRLLHIYRGFKKLALEVFFPVKKAPKKNEENLYEHFNASVNEDEKYVHSLLNYNYNEVRNLVIGLKYRNSKRAAKILGTLLCSYMIEEISEMTTWEGLRFPVILVPMPISDARRKERGYNQCERLLEEVSDYADGEWLHVNSKVLIKTKHTESQTKKKNRSERLQNVVGSLEITLEASSGEPRESIRGCDVILIDDVTTTGSTVKEALHILQNGGARTVRAITVARQELKKCDTVGSKDSEYL